MSGEGLLPDRIDTGHGRKRIPRGTVICPVCDHNAQIHGGEHVTKLVKTLWCRCTNLACNMSWRMQLSFEFVISPSGYEHNLDLPISPQTLQRAPPGVPPVPDPDQLTMFAGGDGDDEEPTAQAAA